MLYGVADISRNLLGLGTRSQRLRAHEFWALDDISFELKHGESLGIIGPNGSGKSTVLKLINGIMPPDRGKITVQGRVTALIELGAGFHPMLTGRQNIYISGAILGMTKKELDSKFGDITRFADIGAFIDSPVKYYSSGMFARLGFSTAVHIEPDLLLVDEVLSVGDADFRSKSYQRMLSFKEQGRSICLVSHDMMSIQAVCDRVIWLNEGRIQLMGTPEDVIPRYYKHEDERGLHRDTFKLSTEPETEEIVITEVETWNGQMRNTQRFHYGDRFAIRLHYKTRAVVRQPFFIVAVRSSTGGNLFGTNMLTDGGQLEYVEGAGTLDIEFDTLPLYPGLYSIVVQVRKDPGVNYFSPRVMAHFAVVSDSSQYGHSGIFTESYIHGGGIASVVVPYTYQWNRAPQRDHMRTEGT